jgi:hypothetical protein
MRKVRCEAFSDEEIVSVGARVGTHTFDTCGHDSPMSLFDMSPTLVACVGVPMRGPNCRSLQRPPGAPGWESR